MRSGKTTNQHSVSAEHLLTDTYLEMLKRMNHWHNLTRRGIEKLFGRDEGKEKANSDRRNTGMLG